MKLTCHDTMCSDTKTWIRPRRDTEAARKNECQDIDLKSCIKPRDYAVIPRAQNFFKISSETTW